MLHTITANLLAETTAHYDALVPGKTHRAHSVSFQVGGKGVNVARAAHKAGLQSAAHLFVGGAAGERCREWFGRQDFSSHLYQMSEETRSGWVVRTRDGMETTFLGADAAPSNEQWQPLFRNFSGFHNAWIAVCGSVPSWNPVLAMQFREAIQAWKANGCRVVLDTYGPALMDLSQEPVDLVKINRQEWKILSGDESTPLSTLAPARPIPRWIVTNGDRPIEIWDREEGHWEVTPPTVRTISPVGCGDLFLASIIKSELQNEGILDAVDRAARIAAAAAASPEVSPYLPEEAAGLAHSGFRQIKPQ